jgi:hypothetical protein
MVVLGITGTPILSLLKTVVFHDAVCCVDELQSFPNLNEPENS